MGTCATGFSVQEVLLLLAAVGTAAVGIATPLFRALMSQSKELLDIQRDQVNILREQAETQKQTEQAIRRTRPR